jgi:hypothetical protein
MAENACQAAVIFQRSFERMLVRFLLLEFVTRVRVHIAG